MVSNERTSYDEAERADVGTQMKGDSGIVATAKSTDGGGDPLAKLRIQRDAPTSRNSSSFPRKWKWLILLLLLMVVVAVGGWTSLQQGWLSAERLGFQIPESMQPRPEVTLALLTVESGRAADATVVATGYLESRRQAKIGARAPGRIEAVYVEEGSRVTHNDVLAVLEHADLDASLAATKATLARAKAEIEEQKIAIANSQSNYDRATELHSNNTISEAEFETAEFEYRGAVARLASLQAAADLAEARVKEAEQMRENMFVRAPFDGTVISKDGEVGESILPGGMGEASGRGSVVTIADLEHLEVDCDVKEDYISRVHSGQPAEVAVDAVPGKRYRAQVRKIIPMGDRARATIKVKVEILNVDSQLFPDMSATVYFLPNANAASADNDHADAPRVFCDAKAILQDEQGPFVWLLDDSDHVERTRVMTGATRDGRIEIMSGLTGKERVAVTTSELRAGQLIKLVQ